MQLRYAGEKVTRFYFSGEAGTSFHIDDKAQEKLKKDIVKVLEDYAPKPDRYLFEFRAVDGFSEMAVDAVMSFINTRPVVCSFQFRSVFAGDYNALPTKTQNHYRDIISELIKREIPTDDKTEGSHILKHHDKFDISQIKINYYCTTSSGPACIFVSYFDKNTKDEWIKDEFDWHTGKNISKINLYKSPTGTYTHTEYTGVRKQKNTSKYSYRINIKLPDGTLVKKEKGSFFTAREADIARRKYLIALTTQDCEDVDKTVDDVFEEFICVTCKDKESLKKKYISYYNSHLKDSIGKLKIGETKYELERVYKYLKSGNVKDNRSKNTRCALSKGYVAGLRAMLCNFFDYAYNMRYIKSHPMYALPEKWGSDRKGKHSRNKEKNNFIQPLFAYLGNKHRLLPDIQKLFPQDAKVFIDLFGGSGIVGINSNAEQIVINDSNLFLIGIYKGIQTSSPDVAWDLIKTIIDKYSLDEKNESGYYTCRDEYNSIPYKKRCIDFWYWGLVLVWCSFNRSTVQFNQQGEYNAPFGFNKVNFDLARRKFCVFAKKVSGSQIVFLCDDYKNIDIPTDAFVYIDPPYLITTATYNKGWNEQDEKDLYDYLEKLDDMGVKWAMSNVLENNGKTHTLLPEQINKKKYRVHYLDGKYIHANFRRKNKGKTVEVLVTNY